MYETAMRCPICQLRLTDVDGMLECQNKNNEPHFTWGYGRPFFNYKIWASTIETKREIIKRLK